MGPASKDTPVQTHSPLPSLIYFYPPAGASTTSGGEGPPENPTSHPQPPIGADIFPRTTLNQTLLPQPPSHNVSLYGQLPPLPSVGPRRVGYAPRRITFRDPEPRLDITERDLEQAYGPRIPSLIPGQRQSLYDWAPAQIGPASARLRPINADGGRERRAQLDNGTNRPFSTAASLRRYMRGQPQRSRNIWAWYAADAERERERARQRDRDREGSGSSGVSVGHNRAIATARRSSIARESISFTSCKDIEETLKYLEKLRRCNSIGESLRLALASGFTRDTAWLSYDGCDCSFDDFLLDTKMLKAVKTSWLDIGGTFWGSQTTLASLGSSNLASEAYSPNRWTVKVNISGIDYDNLNLNGTMEAYADWERHAEIHSHNHTNNTMTPIITYLEGEIIDFRTHTLQTTSYTSTITDDALYWQKLEPFSYYEPATLMQLLTSKMFLEKLMGEYVLMRWKEKCFIKGGTGGSVSTGGLLTIGGFYFVSMRRSDGAVRGFYYDPKSTPYQELVLKPRKRVFPTYDFR
ncbi:vacuolar import and degradation protein-domain-containing protein [Tirmania nivea]|nr:vacuolar import and degradation protein-domain-containing protein [Tirmania nivea]